MATSRLFSAFFMVSSVFKLLSQHKIVLLEQDANSKHFFGQ